MGTNYYLKRNCCEHCGRSDESLHIGKSSMGWCFSLHVDPDENINSLDDWVKLFEYESIVDEYSTVISTADMLKTITEREGKGFDGTPGGYGSWGHFHARNNSEEGPNGLLRHKRGSFCVGHGEGTWDLMTGEFG